MQDITPERLDVLRRVLAEFHQNLGNFVSSHGPEPSANSPGAKEHAQFPGSSSLVTAMASVWQLIELGGDHVTLLVKALTEPMVPIAFFTTLRSMLESCALATWLLDPTIDAQGRIKRMTALRFSGLIERQKFTQAKNIPSENEKIAKHIEKVIDEANRLGLEVRRDGKVRSKVIFVGQSMPTATEMIRTMLDEELNYRLLSGVAHGHAWAIFSLAYKTIDVPSESKIGGVPIHLTVKRVPEYVNQLAFSAAKALATPAWYQCRYLGWNDSQLASIFEQTFDELWIKPEERFWL
jgi:hypothetical protein